MSDITREEVIEHLKNMKMPHDKFYEETDETNKTLIDKGNEALDMATKALAQTRWIPVSERLPKEFDTYLITLEDGVVCQCGFNPDFWDEDNNREGAFTYYRQYFDQETLGLIDEEEEAVDAIAWMPFEPYKAESEDKE